MVGGTRTPVNNAPNCPTLDVFLDEDIEYARKLIEAGVPTEIHVYPGVFHSSEIFVPKVARSTASIHFSSGSPMTARPRRPPRGRRGRPSPGCGLSSA
jgi:hypothetical protein